jgi:hypothetical protein
MDVHCRWGTVTRGLDFVAIPGKSLCDVVVTLQGAAVQEDSVGLAPVVGGAN